MTSNYTATLFHGGSVRTMNAASVNANNVLPGHTGAFSRLKYGSVQKPYRSRQHYYFDAGYTNHGQHIGTNNSGTASNFGVNQTDGTAFTPSHPSPEVFFLFAHIPQTKTITIKKI